jgi:Holliday junction resolvase RusA-like endonuclease
MEDTMEIVLDVPGQPVPQPRPRFTRMGGGRTYTPTGHAIHGYRQAIELVAKASGKTIAGATVLDVDAVFARPPSHWRKHDLKPDSPAWPRGDGDNVLKAVADALTDAGIWPDDDQVVDWRIKKRYAARNEQPRTVITIRKAS